MHWLCSMQQTTVLHRVATCCMNSQTHLEMLASGTSTEQIMFVLLRLCAQVLPHKQPTGPQGQAVRMVPITIIHLAIGCLLPFPCALRGLGGHRRMQGCGTFGHAYAGMVGVTWRQLSS